MKLPTKVAAWAAATVLVLGGGTAGAFAIAGTPDAEPKQKIAVIEEAPVADVEDSTFVVEAPAPVEAPVVEASVVEAPAPVVAPAPAPAPIAPSGAARGTPLPMTTITDPNNGQFGQSVIAADPASFCANRSASTVNGVPVCD